MRTLSNQDRQLAEYLFRRLEYLVRCNTEFQNSLIDEPMSDLLRRVNDGEIGPNDPAVSKTYFHVEAVLGNTFRYTMLVGACAYLEEALKLIAARLIPDYITRMSLIKHGNWLAKHIQVLNYAGFDTSLMAKDLEQFHHLIVLRNCVVHAWGDTTKESDTTRIHAAVDAVATAIISRKRHLFFGDQVVPEALVVGDRIVRRLIALLPADVAAPASVQDP